MPRREGSPWTGLWTVVAKEMADHLTGVRMRVFELLIVLTAGGTFYLTIQSLNTGSGDDPFLFLKFFTTSSDPLPSFAGFLGFLIPLLAITLGFDAVNGEFNRRTLSRVLAQPLYRDALLFGKFLAGLFTLTTVLSAIWLLIFGLATFRLGVPPGGEEVGRSLLFLLSTLAYGAVWLSLSLLFSIAFRQMATAALVAIAVWLFFLVFWNVLAGALAQALQPIRYGFVGELLNQAQLELNLARIAPNTLYSETILVLLNPVVRSLGPILPSQLEGVILGTPLPLDQSILLIWPQLTALAAVSILLFVIGYVLFQRQEIRA